MPRRSVGAGHDGDVVAMCSGSKLTQKGFPQVDLIAQHAGLLVYRFIW